MKVNLVQICTFYIFIDIVLLIALILLAFGALFLSYKMIFIDESSEIDEPPYIDEPTHRDPADIKPEYEDNIIGLYFIID